MINVADSGNMDVVLSSDASLGKRAEHIGSTEDKEEAVKDEVWPQIMK